MTAPAQSITSSDNPRFRALLKLQQSSRERRKAGRSLLDGVHLTTAYLQNVGAPEEIVVSSSGLDNAEIATLVARSGVKPVVLSDALFRELSPVTTPTGILCVVETPRPAAVPKEPGACVILEDIQDPGNVGSILRSAAAAGVLEVYVSRGSVHAWSPRVLRAAMGAHFVVRIYENIDLASFVEAYPGKVFATRRDAAVPVFSADLRGRVGLIFGNEGAGLSPSLARLAHQAVSIPMPGKAESLNVAAAAAVCLFEKVRQEFEPRRALVRGDVEDAGSPANVNSSGIQN
jgi:TrmH family RNA methyltransferase